ncbi:MAG: glycosyltransferase family 39 protein [Hungatella sp.]|nr:glycosyltransferase family 39 protein [Hungatella sp.]
METRRFGDDSLLFYIAVAFLLFMMVFNLTHSSPWGDEWVEYTISQKSIRNGDMYRAIINTFQPPLYNFLMHFWLKIGKSVLWFRMFNVLCGAVSGICIYKSLKNMTTPLLAAGVVCSMGATYRWIYCIQECSEYALMLMFLCISLYYYIKINERNRTLDEIIFILACVGGMYSQYGAFFIVFPLLIAHLIKKCLAKEKRKIWNTAVMYLFALAFFALPLYMLFAKKQLEHNRISENSNIIISLKDIKNFFSVIGRLIGYFFDVNDRWMFGNFMEFVGISTVIAGVILLIKKTTPWLLKSLVSVLLSAYIIHYWLVIFHIYAMVHPNQSAGFYGRYSYFYMPIFYLSIPTIWYEIICSMKNRLFAKWTIRGAVFGVIAIILTAYPELLSNWHKTYDQDFAKIWLHNGGFQETTYLIGMAEYGFEYYTAPYAYELKGTVLSSDDIDLEDLPNAFWLWRTNWGGDKWNETVETAIEQGYEVMIYADYGDPGQLAYCIK